MLSSRLDIVRSLALVAVGVGLFAAPTGCSNQLSDSELERLEESRVEVFFNSTGTRQGNQYDLKPSEFLVREIDDAETSINVAAYGFDKPNIVHALLRAWDRGVDIRFVGDSTHLDEYGYEKFLDRHIPMQVGNEYSIMHDKFFVIDDRFVLTGTGNITPTGYGRNVNNWIFLESGPAAHDFNTEFQQMFEGRFSQAKTKAGAEDVSKAGDPRHNTYQIGDTKVEVYFTPQERAMQRMLEEIREADTSIRTQIFAFTKNEVGSALIQKHREFARRNDRAAEKGELPGDWRTSLPPRKWEHKIQGLLDRSQVHGNGQYHEVYRLEAFGVPLRIDANEASIQPGDYQAGGGRLHTKTMILDAGTDDARVITGSFNWSSSATVANDETLTILHGRRITRRFVGMFENLWTKSRNVPDGMCSYLKIARERPEDEFKCSPEVDKNDVVFSEVHWDGWNGRRDSTAHTGPIADGEAPEEYDCGQKRITKNRNVQNEGRACTSNDEFIELYNTTDQPIDMSLWSITNGNDFVVGFPPGTVIQPDQYFLVVDHNLGSYSELKPQRRRHAFENPDFVLNTANDPRFPRLSLKNTSLHLELRRAGADRSDDPKVIDTAGDHGPPFYGGRHVEVAGRDYEGNPVYTIDKNYSMERRLEAKPSQWRDGTSEGAWRRCQREKGGKNVRDDYRDDVVATPGAPNSK